MGIKEWSIKELESMYINVFILEENTYVRLKDKIKKQKVYIFIGLNLKGYKNIIGVFIPEEETTGFWLKVFSNIKERGLDDIFMVSMINNKYLKKVFKMYYSNIIQAPSMVEFYNKTYNYIARKDHRIVMREISRIYKAETIEEGKKIYYNLIEDYKENKLIIMIINKYINEIFDMYKYGVQARRITSNTDSYNKMRSKLRWEIKKVELFESISELRKYLYEILKKEEEKWCPSVKRWDKIVNEIDCDIANKIYEMI